MISQVNLLVFSDFSYGCLPQPVVERIADLARRHGVMMVGDSQASSQLGDISRFQGMRLITPTEREAREVFEARRLIEPRLVELFVKSATAEAVAEALQVSAGDVLVCSTGLIGEQLDRDKLLSGVRDASAALSTDGGELASLAIMTTDSVPKRAQFTSPAGWHIGGMAKGAGMLAPGLATMLVVITTDAHLTSPELDTALRAATRVTFDRLDSDGCMSTNDQDRKSVV